MFEKTKTIERISKKIYVTVNFELLFKNIALSEINFKEFRMNSTMSQIN